MAATPMAIFDNAADLAGEWGANPSKKRFLIHEKEKKPSLEKSSIKRKIQTMNLEK
jgi:hypothetical protein